MAISYPVTAPVSTLAPGRIEITPNQAISVSTSPFTYAQQVIGFSGERWELMVSLPPVRKNLAEPWVAFLTSLRGPYGTFLMGDPNGTAPQGTLTAMSITGSAGDRTVTCALTGGNIKAGDWFQLGTGSSARLHKVLKDASSTTLEIWPALRSTYSGESAVITNTVGHFRLASTAPGWSIDDNSHYTISFEAVEVTT